MLLANCCHRRPKDICGGLATSSYCRMQETSPSAGSTGTPTAGAEKAHPQSRHGASPGHQQHPESTSCSANNQTRQFFYQKHPRNRRHACLLVNHIAMVPTRHLAQHHCKGSRCLGLFATSAENDALKSTVKRKTMRARRKAQSQRGVKHSHQIIFFQHSHHGKAVMLF